MLNQHLQLRRAATASSRRRRNAGFTVPEVLVGMTLGLLTIAAFLDFNRVQLFAVRTQSTQLELQTTARNVLDLFTGEVRRAGFDPKCVKSFEAISEATSTRIHLIADLNMSGIIGAPGEDVTYNYNSSGRTFTRLNNGVTETLFDANQVSVSSVTIQYYDGSNVELVPPTGGLSSTQRASIRRVRLTLALQSKSADPQSTRSLAATFQSTVDLRNRFFVAAVNCS
ncbi:MAG: hypothetical protein HY270_19235 [Deltaproteobacteria bacterium]|nr:hypothetical protein [Deltaproteobacteria bacterium]